MGHLPGSLGAQSELNNPRRLSVAEIQTLLQNPEVFVTEGVAAQLLGGLAGKTLARWRAQGRGPAYTRVGGIRYKVGWLLQYINQNAVDTLEQAS